MYLVATAMSLRAARIGDTSQTMDRLWSVFLRRLRKLVEEYYTAKLEGDLILMQWKPQ